MREYGHLLIAGPTRDAVPAVFAVDLAQLYAHTRERGPWSMVTLGLVPATYIHVGREFILEQAVLQGMSHILWVDTDMSFPPESACLLADRNVSVVAVNYVTRTVPHRHAAFRDGCRVETSAESEGLEPVDWLGMGLFLMRVDIVKALPRPWFTHGRNESGRDVGEDVMFCRALRAAGHTVFVDHDLSKAIGHVGQAVFRTVEEGAAEVERSGDRRAPTAA